MCYRAGNWIWPYKIKTSCDFENGPHFPNWATWLKLSHRCCIGAIPCKFKLFVPKNSMGMNLSEESLKHIFMYIYNCVNLILKQDTFFFVSVNFYFIFTPIMGNDIITTDERILVFKTIWNGKTLQIPITSERSKRKNKLKII